MTAHVADGERHVFTWRRSVAALAITAGACSRGSTATQPLPAGPDAQGFAIYAYDRVSRNDSSMVQLNLLNRIGRTVGSLSIKAPSEGLEEYVLRAHGKLDISFNRRRHNITLEDSAGHVAQATFANGRWTTSNKAADGGALRVFEPQLDLFVAVFHDVGIRGMAMMSSGTSPVGTGGSVGCWSSGYCAPEFGSCVSCEGNSATGGLGGSFTPSPTVGPAGAPNTCSTVNVSCTGDIQDGSGWGLTKTSAVLDARWDAGVNCQRSSECCTDCCAWIGAGGQDAPVPAPSCGCAFGDFGCNCHVAGRCCKP